LRITPEKLSYKTNVITIKSFGEILIPFKNLSCNETLTDMLVKPFDAIS